MLKKIIQFIIIISIIQISCTTKSKQIKDISSFPDKKNLKQVKEKLNFKTFGGDGDDIGNSIIKINNTTNIIVGSTKQKDIWSDVWVMMIQTNGTKIWEKTFGGDHIDWGEDISSYDNNNYYIAGTTYSYGKGNGDIYLIKINKKGNKLWERYYGGRDWDGTEKCLALSNGCIIAGWTSSWGNGKQDIYILRTDSNGNKIWDKFYGTSMDDYAVSLCKAPEGFIIAGVKSITPEIKNIWIIKINNNGKIIWQKTYEKEYHSIAKDIIQDDKGFIIIGTKTIPGKNKDIWIFKIKQNGTILWEKLYGYENDDIPTKIIKSGKNSYMITGYKQNIKSRKKNIFMLKIDSKGHKIKEFSKNNPASNEAKDLILINKDKYIITGSIESSGQKEKDLLFLKIYLK